MKNRIHTILLVILCSCLVTAQAQVSVLFNPAINGQSIDGLALAQLSNASVSDGNIALTIKVKETNGLNVVTIQLPSFFIPRGISPIDRVAFSNARFTFAPNDLGTILRQSGKFAEGEYEYCFEMEMSDGKGNTTTSFYESCFNFQLQPLTPLLLINPVDGDEFCNKRPDFTWQPPMPLPMGSSFRLLLVELKEKQDIAAAIAYNLPVINQSNIKANTLSYPMNLPELKEDHTYAWQVTVYNGLTILKKSEIWTFTVKCTQKPQDINSDSYRELKETDDGNFYVTKQFLKFSFINPYNPGDLVYTIECLSDPQSHIKHLPKLKVVPGLNKYELDLSDNRSFKTGMEYLLKVQLPNSRRLSLRFIYKND